jgi:replicative DNA helicase
MKQESTNLHQATGMNTKALKGIAKELNVPILVLAQLSRSVETRGGTKRPILSDLRESGSIEEDADMVWFIYRPEYYGILTDETGQDLRGAAELIVAKNRHGALESYRLRFHANNTRFVSWAEQYFTHEETPF